MSVDVGAAIATTWLEKACVAALEGFGAGRSLLALARAVGRVTREDVAAAVAALRARRVVTEGFCDAAGSGAGRRCRRHGGASSGARTAEGRAPEL
ncbi:hypothetical protein EON77_13190, partial [bacterium]